jgi:hypothetical protein
VRRHLRIAGGFLLLAAGAILSLPGVPGPGIVLIVLGLAILSDHFAWARKLLGWAREKAARLREKAARSGGGRNGPGVA